jgi:DNA-directed RNA polymerase subunit M/transcription elongation factor TFIIS
MSYIPEIKTLETIFQEYTALNDKQINELISISYKGYPLLDLVKRYDFVFEILGLLQEHSFGEIYEFLNSIKSYEEVNSKTVYEFKKFDVLKQTYERNISYVRDRLELKNSTTLCRKCNNKNVRYSTKQTRSGDEPETTIYQCQDCGAMWKE